MSSSIIGGLLESGWDRNTISVSDPSETQRQKLVERFGIRCFQDNAQCVEGAGVLMLATKPQVLREALGSIQNALSQNKPLLASIAAGINESSILTWAGLPLPVVRIMPNTPALVNRGVSALFANDQCTESQKHSVETIMKAVGETIWVDSESDIDTVTGISGSGPAYFFKLMEAMLEKAIENGIDEESAKTLVVETAAGAAKLAKQSVHNPKTLRQQVTSPGGTTQAAILSMESSGIDSTFSNGMDAAIKRSKQLSEELGE